ncbi:MAG TPA: hypothetical protein VGH38_05960 [Bryobacteraceae bacterium]|jgi:hypothetical protein
MDQTVDQTKTNGFDVGTWLGRFQALSLVAGRCSAAVAECLIGIKEDGRYLAQAKTWDEFCAVSLGISRATADRLIRQYKQLGANYSKLNSFVRIKPSEFRLIASSVTDDGLTYGDQLIPLNPENAPKLAEAVEALRREHNPEPAPVDPIGQSFAKAEKSLQAALAEFRRLQEMNLDEEGRLKLLIAVESGRDDLERIRASTTL